MSSTTKTIELVPTKNYRSRVAQIETLPNGEAKVVRRNRKINPNIQTN